MYKQPLSHLKLEETGKGKMFGEWNDNCCLLDLVYTISLMA